MPDRAPLNVHSSLIIIYASSTSKRRDSDMKRMPATPDMVQTKDRHTD